MNSMLQYVQKVMVTGRDGTICIITDTNEVGTLTLKNRSVIGATLRGTTGKVALQALKTVPIIHMEFWGDILVKRNIQRMVEIQEETNEISPPPPDELFPEGAEISSEMFGAYERPTTNRLSIQEDKAANAGRTVNRVDYSRHIPKLANLLSQYIGPAADFIVADTVKSAKDADDLVHLLANELFDRSEISSFSQKAAAIIKQL